MVSALGGLGKVTVSERAVATETMQFKLPPEVRTASEAAETAYDAEGPSGPTTERGGR